MNPVYDYIIVGAGSAGCVIAERLSADPKISVLLIEEGPDDRNWLIRMPKGFGMLLRDPAHATYYPTIHDRGTGQAEIWARGRTLGGSSSLNGMVWIRGQAQDYDDFAAVGAQGWGWADIAPYFRKLENHGLGASDLRGTGGPIEVNTYPHPYALAEAVIRAGEACGLRRKADQNSLDQEGIGYLQLNIDRHGHRVSAARGFLDPARLRPNLTIVTGTRVDRIGFDGKRARTVGCRQANGPVTYAAGREIILCAGALASPKLLQLSGIGPAAHLRSLGIDVIHDSPQVGRNLREHLLLFQQFRLKTWRDCQNRQYAGARLYLNLLRYLMGGTGPLATGSYDVGGFVRTSPDLDRPDAQLMFAPFSLDPARAMQFETLPGCQIWAYGLRPESRGEIRIESSDPDQPARIDPNYLSAEADRTTAVNSVRYIRDLIKKPPLAEVIVEETQATRDAIGSEAILGLFRQQGQAGYHACGTVAMGAETTSPLDARLRVRGVEGLRVMDCSVFPAMISGNTNAPTMAMAWRAADLITQDRDIISR